MRRWTRFTSELATAAILITSAASCTLGEEPNEPSSSGVTYEAPARDLCARARFDQIMARWDLVIPSWDPPTSEYNELSTGYYVRCGFTGVAEDHRFETPFGVFRPRGAVRLQVHHEVADSIDEYDRYAGSYFERAEGNHPEEVSGWWDAGLVSTLNTQVARAYGAPDEPGAAHLNSRLLVRHGNVVVLAYARAEAPLDGADPATNLLEDLLIAMTEETVNQLSRSA